MKVLSDDFCMISCRTPSPFNHAIFLYTFEDKLHTFISISNFYLHSECCYLFCMMLIFTSCFSYIFIFLYHFYKYFSFIFFPFLFMYAFWFQRGRQIQRIAFFELNTYTFFICIVQMQCFLKCFEMNEKVGKTKMNSFAFSMKLLFLVLLDLACHCFTFSFLGNLRKRLLA